MTAADRPRVGDTIATAEQLDALPVGVVMRARNDLLMETGRLASGDRVVWGEGWSDHADAIEHFAPLTVLYVPGEQPRPDTDNARANPDSIYYEPPAWCPGCGDRIPTEVIRERGVCSNCYGTTDDPWAAGRAETTTATTEDVERIARRLAETTALTGGDGYAIAEAALTLAEKTATARTRPTREQIARALDHAGAFCGECGAEPGDFFDSCLECQRWLLNYADAVLALLGGDDK